MSAMPQEEPALRQGEKRAVIDIGSNSVKLLIAWVEGKTIRPVEEKSTQTRLNKGLKEGGDFDPVSIRATLRALRKYIGFCIDSQSLPPLIFATSAARRVSKKSLQELAKPLWNEFGLSLQVISPAQEARWAFRGVCSHLSFQDSPLLITDVGGGSAQLTIGRKGKVVWSRSRPLGAVQLLEEFPVSDPPTATEKAQLLIHLRKVVSELRSEIEADESIKKAMSDFSFDTVKWVGSGGAATILASMHLGLSRFNTAKLEGFNMSSAELQNWVDRIWSLTLLERKSLPGLPSGRADITLTGAAVYLAIMQVFAFTNLSISTRGGRYGALLTPAFHDNSEKAQRFSEGTSKA